MPEPKLRICVCASFAEDVRAALPAHFQGSVEVVELAADCVGFQGSCREAHERVHLPKAERTELMAGPYSVSVSRPINGADDVCALRCTGPSGYPLINREYAEQLVADGAFLLTPGWARHWKSYLRAQGFDQTVARQYFHEFAAQLVLLDTGSDPQSVERLAEMGAYLDLPTRRLPCGLDYLRLFLTGLVLDWRLSAQRLAYSEAGEAAGRQLAEYATTLDMLGTLAGVTDEGEVRERIFDLVTLLFAPGRLHLLSIEDGRLAGVRSRPPASATETAAVTGRLALLADDYELTGDGFLLRVGRGDSHAVLEFGGFVLPEKRDDYLNLALTLAGAFDLALANARSFARLDRARQELYASEERYRALMDQASDAIVLVDVRGTVLEANGQALRVMGKARDEVVGRSIDDIDGAAIQQAVRNGLDELLRCGTASIAGIRLGGMGAEDVVIDANFSMVEVAGRRIIQGIFRDVSERERTARELQALSLSDALTGLRNRRGFALLAEQQIKTAARLGRPLLLLFADVDGLKPVNDIQGHAAGDALLREAAHVLAGCFRDMDVVARVGGDEFVVLQAEAGADAAALAARRLDEAVAAVNAAPGRPFKLSLSLGAATFDPTSPCTLEELLFLADERMYAAKRARKAARGSGLGDA